MKKESFIVLESFAEYLNENPSIAIEIQGHTDNIGNAGFNQTLSEKRAISVKNFLTGKGISNNRLQTKGYGASSPRADNKTVEGRAINRRIEFKVLSR